MIDHLATSHDCYYYCYGENDTCQRPSASDCGSLILNCCFNGSHHLEAHHHDHCLNHRTAFSFFAGAVAWEVVTASCGHRHCKPVQASRSHLYSAIACCFAHQGPPSSNDGSCLDCSAAVASGRDHFPSFSLNSCRLLELWAAWVQFVAHSVSDCLKRPHYLNSTYSCVPVDGPCPCHA